MLVVALVMGLVPVLVLVLVFVLVLAQQGVHQMGLVCFGVTA